MYVSKTFVGWSVLCIYIYTKIMLWCSHAVWPGCKHCSAASTLTLQTVGHRVDCALGAGRETNERTSDDDNMNDSLSESTSSEHSYWMIFSFFFRSSYLFCALFPRLLIFDYWFESKQINFLLRSFKWFERPPDCTVRMTQSPVFLCAH